MTPGPGGGTGEPGGGETGGNPPGTGAPPPAGAGSGSGSGGNLPVVNPPLTPSIPSPPVVSPPVVIPNLPGSSGSCTSFSQAGGASTLVQVTCSTNQFVSIRPLSDSSVLSQADAYRLHFGTESSSTNGVRTDRFAFGTQAEEAGLAEGLLAAQAGANRETDTGRRTSSVDSSGNSMTLVRAAGGNGRGGSLTAVRIENLGDSEGLLEMLVSF